MRISPRRLRARAAVSFAVLGLLLSITLAAVTYELARSYFLGQRESLAVRQAMSDALVARELIAAEPTSSNMMSTLGSAFNARAVVRLNGTWHSAVVDLDESRIPDDLVTLVDQTAPAHQRTTVNGVPYVVVGARLPGVDALYFEFASLSEYRRTMSILGNVLIVAAAITTVAVATVGWLMSRGVMRPLAEVAGTAQAISGGDLSRRLDVAGDRDLEPVADSFNAMAGSLQQRIEREMRFSADVSHELRTPLTVMSSAVALAQRSELSGRGRYAIELIDGQVEHMRRLTVELLEFARIDAGAAELHLDDVDTVALVREQLDAAGLPSHLLRSDPQSDMIIRADRARLERVVANLLENADRYGCGVTAVTLARSQTEFVLLVDDAGPGVAAEEREAIFDRFHRGTATLRGERPKGTGLGLAMVREHVRLHGGRVNVTDAPEGGARFVVRLPVMP